MAKLGPMFLIATTAIILLSFGALCYLMSTVNPKPAKTPENARRYNPIDIPFANEILLKSDNLDYGLEKISEDELVTMNSLEYPHTLNVYRFLSSGDITQIERNITNEMNHENMSAITESILLPIKGHRRSIKEELKNPITIPNSLILNIIDNAGIPKIVIKVGGDKVNKGKNRKRSSNNKIKTISLNKDNNHDNSHQSLTSNNTLVLIEVNDSVVLNIVDDFVNTNDTNVVELASLNMETVIDNTNSNGTESFKNNLKSINESNHTLSFDSLKDITNTEFHYYSDFIENKTVNKISTEEVQTHMNVTNTIDVEHKNTVTNVTDPSINSVSELDNRLVDLLIREETLKGVLLQESDLISNIENLNSTR